MSETTTAQIQALPVDKLEALADALLDFQGPASLAALAGRHGLSQSFWQRAAELGAGDRLLSQQPGHLRP